MLAARSTSETAGAALAARPCSSRRSRLRKASAVNTYVHDQHASSGGEQPDEVAQMPATAARGCARRQCAAATARRSGAEIVTPSFVGIHADAISRAGCSRAHAEMNTSRLHLARQHTQWWSYRLRRRSSWVGLLRERRKRALARTRAALRRDRTRPATCRPEHTAEAAAAEPGLCCSIASRRRCQGCRAQISVTRSSLSSFQIHTCRCAQNAVAAKRRAGPEGAQGHRRSRMRTGAEERVASMHRSRHLSILRRRST